MTDPKRDLAIEAAEAIDPTFASHAMEVAEALDPSIVERADARKAHEIELKARGIAVLDGYQRNLDAGAPRNAAELAELKAVILGADV